MTAPSEHRRGMLPAGLGRVSPPFIGRRRQVQWLESCLQTALAGQAQVVLVPGEPGIGKTRLLREAQAAAQGRGMQVCYGRGYEDLSFPYLSFAESLLPLLERTPPDVIRPVSAEVEIVRSLLVPNQPFPAAPADFRAPDADRHRLQLLLAVSRLVIWLAQNQAMLLVMDDLHWADQPSLELFGHLISAVADTATRETVPLCIVGTYRPDEAEGRLAHLIARVQHEVLCQTMELPGLEDTEITALIQGMGLARPARQLVATISTATRGNPLFIQEVLHYLVTHNTLQERGGYIVTSATEADLQLPALLTGAISARIQGLSEACRGALTLAACLGDHVTLPILCAVSGMADDALLGLLEEGIEQRFLVSEGQTFQFAHPLIRHVFYGAPSTVRRQRLHLRIARTLEGLHAGSLEAPVLEIAHHLIRAGPAAAAHETVDWARKAGDRAFMASAWGEAAHYYEGALRAAEPTAELSEHERAELHYWAGLARYRDMDVGPCLEHYEHALAIFRQLDNLQSLARVLIEKVRAQTTLASVPYGTLADVKALEEVLEALGEAAPELRGEIAARMAQTYWHGGQVDMAEAMASQALDIGRHLGNDRLCAQAGNSLALAQYHLVDLPQALQSWHNALRCARRADDLWQQGLSLTRMPMALTWQGRLDEAEAMADEAWEVVTQTRDWANYSLVLAALVSIAVIRGNFDTAEERTRETLVMLSRSRYPWGGVLALPALAYARAMRGKWTEARGAIDMLIEPGRVFDEPGLTFKADAGVLHRLLDVYRGAYEALPPHQGDQAEEIPEPRRLDVVTMARLCALVEIGAFTSVSASMERADTWLSQAMRQGVLFAPKWTVLLPRIRGTAAALAGRWNEAEEYFQTAIETAIRVGARPELGRSYLDCARMVAARGAEPDHDRALSLVRQAEVVFGELDMVPFAYQAKWFARALRARTVAGMRPYAVHPGRYSVWEAQMAVRTAKSRTGYLG
jgi:tetratricopeptide (TPR) repeat protein